MILNDEQIKVIEERARWGTGENWYMRYLADIPNLIETVKYWKEKAEGTKHKPMSEEEERRMIMNFEKYGGNG